MGEISDEKSARGEKNIWGTVPEVSELQSEAGAAGAVHGALCAGSLTTTFTASQGLLLMIPNMYKIAGELTPTVFHVSARALACQGLSIFGDHSDVMSIRQTGFAMLASTTVQEAMDLTLISHAATLEARIPFLHFFDGFRTSHEVQKIEELTFDDMRAMIDMNLVRAFRSRAMTPDKPHIKGTAQNPDVYFQGRETVNKYYAECPAIVQKYMDLFAKLTGRQYNLFDYVGAPDAEKLIIIMGSGADTVHETSDFLNAKGAKTGVLKVRLYRPFDASAFIGSIPASVKKIAVLDRTKEPGSLGEPLYEDVRTAISEEMDGDKPRFAKMPKIIGGRYGLGSAEFTPAMVKAVYDELDAGKPKSRFVVGINENVTNTSLEYDKSFTVEGGDTYRALFYGLASDGTVGANRNSIGIISNETDNNTQGYFVFDSKKAGTVTVSHLRFGKNTIRRPYLITKANFLACHNFTFVEKYDMLKNLEDGGTFLLASEYDKDAVWSKIPGRVQKQIIDKKLKFYVIDALAIAKEVGLGVIINTIMQAAFFKISNVIDLNVAVDAIKKAIRDSYGSKGEEIVNKNINSIDKGLSGFHEVSYPAEVTNPIEERKSIHGTPAKSNSYHTHYADHVNNVTAKIIRQEGDTIPVSDMPADGSWPVGTTKFEKRNIAVDIPVWGPDACIQCNACAFVCPHGCLRPKAYDASCLSGAPAAFKSCEAKGKELAGMKYSLQVAPEDCTGCALCVGSCPAKDKGALKMEHQMPLRAQEAANWEFFLTIPDTDPKKYDITTVKGSQFVRPLFEFSGACLGCGETAYIKMLTQLVGDRLYIANATGCTSIYSGNLPTTPYTTRDDGRGPTWNNSLFEDTAELAFGMRLSVDKFAVYAKELCERIKDCDGVSAELKTLVGEIVNADQSTTELIDVQRGRVAKAKELLSACSGDKCNETSKELISVIDYLVKKSVWAIGGDGWAYDIGYGGLDHVIAANRNVKLLVLDTEVYSNTGGQASKSTPMGAVAKFAAGGKPVIKKDLGLIAMSYGYVYVARVAMGTAAHRQQALKAMIEAENYDGPAIVLAYSHCIAHGINMSKGYDAQKDAVESGHWPLYRYNPELAAQGKNPLVIDSKDPTIALADYAYKENRYKILQRSNPDGSKQLVDTAQQAVTAKIKMLKQMAAMEM
jgi:pyruvate-ferredoxin/flavodoxin oxidoreductase